MAAHTQALDAVTNAVAQAAAAERRRDAQRRDTVVTVHERRRV